MTADTNPPPGTLYLIPVPLGGIDPSWVVPEPVRQLACRLDTFVVEHPKTARHILKLYGITRPLQEITLLTLNEHTPATELDALLQPMLASRDVGLMSEAGCPGVADPGADLVRLAHNRNIRVVPLVGPSSILLALMASGLNGQGFVFHGYLPAEKEQRIKKLGEIERDSRNRGQTQIFIETPYRNRQMLADILDSCQKVTLLTVAVDITLPTEYIHTRTIADWQKTAAPELHKRPAIFLLHSPS
ncbi:MAG: SAM-dependent methyltransferase [Sulfuricellaceae bacterium]|nr:SAM-dependent methyltransferase [Sulfuricellaceae bacterium]